MSDKTFKIVGNDISDGYHTFDELYEHRCLLWLAWLSSDGCPGDIYVKRDHFPGWDLVAVEIPTLGQISYHVPVKYRDVVNMLPAFGRPNDVYVFDGHTSQDVIQRLKKWIETGCLRSR